MRILLVTYFFKPVKNVCADRPDSLYKFSDTNGFDVDVVTTGSLLDGDIKDHVTRVDNIDGWNKHPYNIKKILAKLLTKIVSPFFLNVDFLWYKNVIKRSCALCTANSYNAIYVVYPHVSCLLVGVKLNKIFNIPLFVDFTDCIGFDPLDPPTHFLQKRMQLYFEKTVIQRACGVFTIAATYERYFKEHYQKKAVWNVYNGFDPDDYKELSISSLNTNHKKVRVVLFGSICASRERDVMPLFSAIAKLKMEQSLSSKDIEFLFIGKRTDSENKAVKAMNVGDIVQFSPYIDKREGFKLISETCDYLLHYGVEGATSAVCSKLLEYLRLYKPILGICKGNEAEMIINRARAGEVASFTTESIAALFLRALNRNIMYNPDYNYIESFSRVSQASFIFSRIKECLLNR